MLLARTLAGALGDALGWRAPYLLAAAATGLTALALARVLPSVSPPSRLSYRRLLGEPVRLLAAEPQLRRSCLYQATAFADFSAVWSAVALLLTGPTYGYGASSVGLLALVNVATMLCAPVAGRVVDRRGSDPVNLVSLLGLLAAAVLLAGGAAGGPAGLGTLVAGTLVLDVAMQTGMVANVARHLALRADARSRLTTAYTTCAYTAGSAGSWAGAHFYARAGCWPASRWRTTRRTSWRLAAAGRRRPAADGSLRGSRWGRRTYAAAYISGLSDLWDTRAIGTVPLSIAFAAGALAVVNPCGFPLLPAFLLSPTCPTCAVGASWVRRHILDAHRKASLDAVVVWEQMCPGDTHADALHDRVFAEPRVTSFVAAGARAVAMS